MKSLSLVQVDKSKVIHYVKMCTHRYQNPEQRFLSRTPTVIFLLLNFIVGIIESVSLSIINIYQARTQTQFAEYWAPTPAVFTGVGCFLWCYFLFKWWFCKKKILIYLYAFNHSLWNVGFFIYMYVYFYIIWFTVMIRGHWDRKDSRETTLAGWFWTRKTTLHWALLVCIII